MQNPHKPAQGGSGMYRPRDSRGLWKFPKALPASGGDSAKWQWGRGECSNPLGALPAPDAG
eukprot:7470400-Alexandrium_andersonii.AAC.1